MSHNNIMNLVYGCMAYLATSSLLLSGRVSDQLSTGLGLKSSSGMLLCICSVFIDHR